MANLTREELAAKKAVADKAQAAEGGVDMRVSENPREPVEPLRDGGPKPVTPASGVVANAKGHSEPVDVGQEAVDRSEAHNRVEMREVVFLRGYQPVTGGFIKEGATQEVPIEDARFLEESGIAQSSDTYKARAK